MAKKVTKDTGMMQRTEIKYRMDDPKDIEAIIEAWKKYAERQPQAAPGDWLGDALHRHNAERCRAILATDGMTDDGMCAVNIGTLRAKGLAENSAQWIAAHWLAEYNALTRGRERFEAGDVSPNNLSRMLMATEEMGRLQERMWWRAGVDPLTGKRREELAISGKKQTRVLDDHRNSANEKKREKAEKRQKIVAEFAAQSSATHGALVREVQRYFKDNYDDLGIRVTDRTIRDDLKKVGKTG